MRRKASICFALALTVLCGAGSRECRAAPILDQSQMVKDMKGFSVNSNRVIGQTVTVGMDGWLDHVTIFFQGSSMGAASDLVFQVRTSLDGSVLFQDVHLQSSGVGGDWRAFDTRSSNLWFDEGDSLAITLDVIPRASSTPYGWVWWGGMWDVQVASGSYTRGTAYIKDLTDPSPSWEPIPNDDITLPQGNDIFDFAFQTHMDPDPIPVPGAFWLLGSGLTGLLGWRRFRKQG